MPAQASPKNSVWTAMNYTPPRGPCNWKASLMSPACACMRFMLHPVKAATSFECDGCSHHASFHSMENAVDDAVMKRWQAQESEQGNKEGQAAAGAGRKRRRIADTPASVTASEGQPVEAREILEIEDGDETDLENALFGSKRPTTTRAATRITAAKTKRKAGENAYWKG